MVPSGLRISLVACLNSMFAYASWPTFVNRLSNCIYLFLCHLFYSHTEGVSFCLFFPKLVMNNSTGTTTCRAVHWCKLHYLAASGK